MTERLPTLTMWMPRLDGAKCVGTDPESYFTMSHHASVNEADLQAIQRMCRSCPVRMPCLRWALENREHGIWAGTTEEQRQQMKASA